MMRRIWTIARHEVRGYFDQPTAYVLAVAFLGISLFLGFRNMYASNLASMRPLFDLLPMLFAVRRTSDTTTTAVQALSIVYARHAPIATTAASAGAARGRNAGRRRVG